MKNKRNILGEFDPESPWGYALVVIAIVGVVLLFASIFNG